MTVHEDYDLDYDAGETGCGELLLDLKVFFRDLEPGTVVRVKTYDSGAPNDLQAWCRMREHTVLKVDPPYVTIRK